MMELPRLGSSKNGLPWQMAKGLKEDYARLIGVTLEEADHVVNTVGAVIQDRLLRGQPCGIPYVCTLYVRRFEYHIRPGSGILANSRMSFLAKKFLKPELLKPRKIKTARVQMRVVKEVGNAVRLCSPYTKELEEFFSDAMRDSSKHGLQLRILKKRELYKADAVTGAQDANRRKRAARKKSNTRYESLRGKRHVKANKETSHVIEQLRNTEAGYSGGRHSRRGNSDA